MLIKFAMVFDTTADFTTVSFTTVPDTEADHSATVFGTQVKYFTTVSNTGALYIVPDIFSSSSTKIK